MVNCDKYRSHAVNLPFEEICDEEESSIKNRPKDSFYVRYAAIDVHKKLGVNVPGDVIRVVWGK
jgi:hypothetical protein